MLEQMAADDGTLVVCKDALGTDDDSARARTGHLAVVFAPGFDAREQIVRAKIDIQKMKLHIKWVARFLEGSLLRAKCGNPPTDPIETIARFLDGSLLRAKCGNSPTDPIETIARFLEGSLLRAKCGNPPTDPIETIARFLEGSLLRAKCGNSTRTRLVDSIQYALLICR
jgi:hypothetical protein